MMKSKKNAKPFGGYVIDFQGREETIEKIMGTDPISPAQMTKKIWNFIKRKDLAYKEK